MGKPTSSLSKRRKAKVLAAKRWYSKTDTVNTILETTESIRLTLISETEPEPHCSNNITIDETCVPRTANHTVDIPDYHATENTNYLTTCQKEITAYATRNRRPCTSRFTVPIDQYRVSEISS
jgi:hypothetical protein